MHFIAAGAATWSLIISIVALAVAALAAVFSFQQAKAEQGANAPNVSATIHGTPSSSKGPATVTITFSGNSEIRSATISIPESSGIDFIGRTETATPNVGKLTIDNVHNDDPIKLSARCSDLNTARLRIDMAGPSFGTVTTNVAVRNTTMFIH